MIRLAMATANDRYRMTLLPDEHLSATRIVQGLDRSKRSAQIRAGGCRRRRAIAAAGALR
jgi:hypothetical protein